MRVYDAELDGGILSGDIGIYTDPVELEPDVNLSGIWNFKIGDDLKWSEEIIKIQTG